MDVKVAPRGLVPEVEVDGGAFLSVASFSVSISWGALTMKSRVLKWKLGRHEKMKIANVLVNKLRFSRHQSKFTEGAKVNVPLAQVLLIEVGLDDEFHAVVLVFSHGVQK